MRDFLESAEMDARFTRQFETLDSRLRNVEVDVAEIKGRKAGWESALNSDNLTKISVFGYN